MRLAPDRPRDLAESFDAVELALRRLAPFDGGCWLSLDYCSGLPASHLSRLVASTHFMTLAANEYPEDDVNKSAVLAGAPRLGA